MLSCSLLQWMLRRFVRAAQRRLCRGLATASSSGVVVRTSPGKGRGLFAERAFAAGEVVLTDTALVTYPPLYFAVGNFRRVARECDGAAAAPALIAPQLWPPHDLQECPHCLHFFRPLAVPDARSSGTRGRTAADAPAWRAASMWAATAQRDTAQRDAAAHRCGPAAASALERAWPLPIPRALWTERRPDGLRRGGGAADAPATATLAVAALGVIQHFGVVHRLLCAALTDAAAQARLLDLIGSGDDDNNTNSRAAASAAGAWPSSAPAGVIDAALPTTALPLWMSFFAAGPSADSWRHLSPPTTAAAQQWLAPARVHALSAFVQSSLWHAPRYRRSDAFAPAPPTPSGAPGTPAATFTGAMAVLQDPPPPPPPPTPTTTGDGENDNGNAHVGAVAMYGLARFMNHACAPYHNVVPPGHTVRAPVGSPHAPLSALQPAAFTAARAIAAGDELLLSYIDAPATDAAANAPTTSPSARAHHATELQRMQRTFGFTCRCPAHS